MSERPENNRRALWGRLRTMLHGKALLLGAGLLGVVLLLFGAFGGGGSSSSSTDDTTASASDAWRESMEREAEALCKSVKGAGDTKVCLTFESGESYTYSGSHLTSTTPPKVSGVAVVCEGGGSATVRQELTELLCALYHIGANRVHVSQMK